MSKDEKIMQGKKILLMKLAMAGGFAAFVYVVWRIETVILLLKYILLFQLNK
jgi:hypothetical protein